MIKSDTIWKIDRKSANMRAEVFTTYKGNNLETLSKQLGLDMQEAHVWLKSKDSLDIVDLNSVGAEKVYTVPNVWITADLMQGGDILDMSVINLGGFIGRNVNTHKPDGAYEVLVTDMYELTSKIAECSGHIYGMIIYAHGDKLGYIYNSANHLYGGKEKIHTMDILTTLSFANYKLAYIYPMQCYSNYAGSADREYKGSDNEKNEENREYFVEKYWEKTRRDPDVYNGAPGLRSVTYNNLDWLIQWQRKAVVVEGYTGMNFLGVDLGV
jgi:hypothetical protein